MGREEIEATHRRAVEQLLSDERILGAVPEDLADVLVRWGIAQLQTAAREAATVKAFVDDAELIRQQARRLADEAAASGGDADTLAKRLGIDGAENARTAASSSDSGAGVGHEHASGAGAAGEAARQPRREQGSGQMPYRDRSLVGRLWRLFGRRGGAA